jgi:hypothetical protein
VLALLAAIAHDSLEGRMTGTPGSLRAATIIARALDRAGLEPAGDSGFFQRVPVALVTQVRNERTVTRPAMFSGFDALDTVPADRHRTAVNVIAVLRGADSSFASEHILVGAHYDHVGIGRAVNGDSIYNGADDDASGVVAVLEIARQLAAGPRPKRTIIFSLTTGEEVGLLGTRWYIDHPALPIEQMVADLQIEMIGRPDSLAGGPGRAWLTGFERSTMGDSFAAAGLPIVPDRRTEQNFFMRSDNIAFARIGIPAHTLSSYNMHADYHQPSDEVEVTDPVHMAAVIDAAVNAVRILADGPKPEWKPGGRPEAPIRVP